MGLKHCKVLGSMLAYNLFLKKKKKCKIDHLYSCSKGKTSTFKREKN